MAMHKNAGNLPEMGRSLPVVASNYLHSDGACAVPAMSFFSGKAALLILRTLDFCHFVLKICDT